MFKLYIVCGHRENDAGSCTSCKIMLYFWTKTIPWRFVTTVKVDRCVADMLFNGYQYSCAICFSMLNCQIRFLDFNGGNTVLKVALL